VVGDPATAAKFGKDLSGNQYKLYSVKTGVSFVGSFNEGLHGKNLLEANSSMAMRRSEVIASMYNSETTFGMQTELLTITAPLTDGGRDGFQVRDLSCLKTGLAYVPGSAIPYARATFDGKEDNDPGGQCEFWRTAFAVPLGRAKARLFLNYGLLHTSANAQNFLVGFNGQLPEQFVTRDVGDTSWHDDYLTRYIQDVPSGKKAYSSCQDEGMAEIYHMLGKTSSKAYPPPHMIRLAAYEVIGHGFDEKLLSPLKTENQASSIKDGCGWTELHVYHFATGVLDGFRSFMKEAFDFGELYPLELDNLEDTEIKTCGEQGPYPYETRPVKMQQYEALVGRLKNESADVLMGKAAAVRRRGTAAMGNDKQAFGRYPFRILLNAEEAFLCGGLEVKLGLWGEKDGHVAERLVKLFEGAWPKIIPDAVVNK
jgi:hypothetical protein